MEQFFAASPALVMPFWVLMMLAPRWRVTQRLIESPFIVAGPVVVYAALVLPDVLSLLPAVARPELATIAALLGQPRGATIGWLHFLALDLFAGRWIYLDARQRGLSAWLLSPLLLLTLLFGPLGLGTYLVLRAVRRAMGRNSAGQAASEEGSPGPEQNLAPSVPRRRATLASAVREFANRVWAGSRPLAWVTLGSSAVLLVSLVLWGLDGRQVTGAPVWLKPAKFAVSIAMAAPMLAWIMGQLQGARRGLRLAGRLMAGTLALELVIITVQAARAVPSHFNAATIIDAVLFAVMGVAITIFWLCEAYIALRAFRQPFASPARTWAIRLGLAATLAGGAIGFVMPRPTATQLASMRAGQPTALLGAHSVGVPDGGPGLPITRWSTEGGDLRIPHFMGLHALQALPLLAWLVERRRRTTARPIVAAAAGWIGLVAVTLGQALRGQPLLAPDGATLAAAAMVLAGAFAVAALPGRPPEAVLSTVSE
jgi:hypothetical protein